MIRTLRHTPPQQEPTPLIGRTTELQRLTTALDRAAHGTGRTVLLAGTMGMGRSRLAHELTCVAQSRGHLVLMGRAYPLDDRLPYAPLISSLGPYLRQLASPQQTELLADLPNLNRLIGGLPFAGDGPAHPLEQVHLLEEVVRLAGRLAQGRPLVWCIDDLHLADPASVEVFYYLARNIRSHKVLLLATYRNDEANGLRHLRVPLLALARHGLSEEIQLGRLSPTDVELLTGQRVGGRPARTLLAYLEARAMGTPLITLSLLDSLQASGLLTRVGGAVGLSPAADHHSVPAAREVILERLLPVGPQERQILDLLAVMGGTAQQGELAQAMQCDPALLLAHLASLQMAGLIHAQERARDLSVQVSLTHPFLQNVLYMELPSLVRRQYHAQVASALEGVTPAPLDRLARQYVGSGGAPDALRALQVILRAAEEALPVCGPDAIDYYRAALALVRGGLLPERLPVVLLGLGQALALAGELARARECLCEALAVCEERGDLHGAGAIHRHTAYIEFMLGDLDATESHVQDGLAQVGADGRSPELPHLYGLRFNVHLLRSETATLPEVAADLARVADLLHTSVARAWHLHAQTWVELLSAQVETAHSLAQASLQEAKRSEDPNLIVMAALDHAHILLLRGAHREAVAVLRDALVQLPRGYLLVAQHAVGPTLSMAETLGGHWEEALQVSDQSAPLEPFIQGLPRANLGARAVILIRRGALDQARACLHEAAQYPRPFITDCDYAEALLAFDDGDYQRAAETAARLHTWSLAPLGLALLAEAQAALGAVDEVRNLAFLLTAMGSLNLPLVAALGTWVTGLADRTVGHAEAAMIAFATAAEQFERLAMPFDAARARFEQAKLLAATDRRGASQQARRSLQVFAQLGADLWIDRVHRWQAGLAPRNKEVKAKPKSDAQFSARELEIIRLLDEGLTSAEIATRLVLSPRTVANHLDRMYTRHGVRNRLSLVHFARDGGLL
ncbi:MAG TPA: AAA family ATPase [Symbiobacteriaceae bacterium]|nr:AAA family ATPase [Symbiobacteriaceae bacterium]